MATVSDASNVDDIPEVEYSINIKPYMYEPEIDSCDKDELDSSDSDIGDDLETPVKYRLPGVEAEFLKNSNWCLCSKCVPTTNQEENICCQSQSILEENIEECSSTCITNHEGFIANCLNIHVLESSFYEVYRHISYRRCVRCVWKILGKRNRKILTSSVVSTIHKTFPSETYTGFKYPRSCFMSSYSVLEF